MLLSMQTPQAVTLASRYLAKEGSQALSRLLI